MSLVLTNVGEKLEITTTGVLPFTVHYADYIGTTPAFTPGVVADNTINGTKDLLAAPGSGQRTIRTISVHNISGSGSYDVTIQLDDSGTNYIIVKVTLADGYTLSYDEDGWKVLDTIGGIQTTLVGGTTQHDILSASHADAATDAVTRGSMIIGNATPKWDELVVGTVHQMLKVNVGGTDPTWASFDWDDLAAAAAADMVHNHSAGGEGGTLDWDTVWSDAVHSHGSAAEGGTALGPLASITMAEDAWIGIGAALERIVFDGSAGIINVLGANLGIGCVAIDALTVMQAGADANQMQLQSADFNAGGGVGEKGEIRADAGRLRIQVTKTGTGAWGDITLGESGGSVGIGCVPGCLLDVEQTSNGLISIDLTNPSAGASARADIRAISDDGNLLQLAQFGSGHALANQGWVFTGGVSNVLILGTVGTERVRIDTTGVVKVDQTVQIKERAAAAADTAAYGQLWVKNTTPCELWFTDDAGTDTQIV